MKSLQIGSVSPGQFQVQHCLVLNGPRSNFLNYRWVKFEFGSGISWLCIGPGPSFQIDRFGLVLGNTLQVFSGSCQTFGYTVTLYVTVVYYGHNLSPYTT